MDNIGGIFLILCGGLVVVAVSAVVEWAWGRKGPRVGGERGLEIQKILNYFCFVLYSSSPYQISNTQTNKERLTRYVIRKVPNCKSPLPNFGRLIAF